MEADGAHRDGASVRQLAQEAGSPEVTAGRILRELTRDGYPHELDDGAFTVRERCASPSG
ncbi:hypothetical protein ACIP3B_28055 [Streptomyces anulatus]|uniref:hypothetical protein n=1 Tax=Streptomyces anulatus TaxID=1892 RepID=UPI0034116BEE